MTGEDYERCVEQLLRDSGLRVEHEPRINGLTPDFRVCQPDGIDIVIECYVREMNPEHKKELDKGSHVCGGNIAGLHSNIYSALEEKATCYQKIVESHNYGYVVAVYDEDCGNVGTSKIEALVYSAHVVFLRIALDGTVLGRGLRDVWSTSELSASLFRLYPHLSGTLYWPGTEAVYFLPNPWADQPVSGYMFPFAQVVRWEVG